MTGWLCGPSVVPTDHDQVPEFVPVLLTEPIDALKLTLSAVFESEYVPEFCAVAPSPTVTVAELTPTAGALLDAVTVTMSVLSVNRQPRSVTRKVKLPLEAPAV